MGRGLSLHHEQSAKSCGTSISAAAHVLDAWTRLTEHPVISNAMRNGELSAHTAEAIASAATVAPDAAEEFVLTAKRRHSLICTGVFPRTRDGGHDHHAASKLLVLADSTDAEAPGTYGPTARSSRPPGSGRRSNRIIEQIFTATAQTRTEPARRHVRRPHGTRHPRPR